MKQFFGTLHETVTGEDGQCRKLPDKKLGPFEGHKGLTENMRMAVSGRTDYLQFQDGTCVQKSNRISVVDMPDGRHRIWYNVK